MKAPSPLKQVKKTLCTAMLSRQSGITLQEMALGLVILGSVTAYFIPQLLNAFDTAQWNAEAEGTVMNLYATLEDAREKNGMLQAMSGPALAIIPRQFVGNDMDFFGTTALMGVSDPQGNRFGAGLPAAVPIDYISDADDPENQCITDVGNYTMQLKSNVYVANMSRGWPKSYMGECVNIVCVFNARQNRRIYVALFRKSNRTVMASSYSPTFDSAQDASECDALDATVPNVEIGTKNDPDIVDAPAPAPTPAPAPEPSPAPAPPPAPGGECTDSDPGFGIKVDCTQVTAE